MKKPSAAVLFLGLSLAAAGGSAEDRSWKNTTGFTFLSTRGNSQSRTLGASEKLEWAKDHLGAQLWGGALNVESGDRRTDERYEAGEKVEWKFTERNYVFERFLWESNRFAGYRHRYDASAGLGRHLIKTDADDLSAEVGGGYIHEQRNDPPREEFGSGRAYLKYVRELRAGSRFSQDAEYLHNFDEPNGYRVNTETAVVAAIANHLALKLSYTWKHVHEPPAGFKRDDTLSLVSLQITY